MVFFVCFFVVLLLFFYLLSCPVILQVSYLDLFLNWYTSYIFFFLFICYFIIWSDIEIVI